jgi:DNA-binding transcriptional regulator YdaS (Cro superfamily)
MDDGMQLLRAKRGAMAAAAREAGITRQAVADWERVPAEHLPAVERATGIPRHVLRPDICIPPAKAAA